MKEKLFTGKKTGTILSAPAEGRKLKCPKALVVIVASLLLFPAMSPAQNMEMHYDNPGVLSIDYTTGMPWGDGYVLGGTVNPPTVAGISNVGPAGNISRIRLQPTDATLNTQWLLTYVEDDEFTLMQQTGCNKLNLWFTVKDTKQTKDGGFIICGRVRREGEFSNCGGPKINEPFLLKTKADGSVEWYKRYAPDADFVSVVQDAANSSYVVCGTYKTDAMVLGADKNGTFLWATTVPPISAKYTTAYSEVAPFISGGKTYYAVVGNVWYYQSWVEDMVLTVVDANGTHYQDAIIDRGVPSFQGWGVHDAHDGKNIVITGQTSEYNTDPAQTFLVYPIIMKINPLSLAMDFVKGYYYFLDADHLFTRGAGRSITHGPNAQDHIAVAGWGGFTDWAYSNIYPNGLYLEVKYDGSLVRYTHLQPDLAYSGLGIVHNLNTGYPAFSGFADNNESFAIRNNYGFDCGNDIQVSTYDLEPYTKPLSYKNLQIAGKDYGIRPFPVPLNEYLACGQPRPTSVSNISITNGIILSPNPAHSLLEVRTKNRELAKITVYDITGRLMLTKEVTAALVSVDLSQLAAGAYLLVAEDKTGRADRMKFVKE